MQIEITESEARTLQFYIRKALIDAEGKLAIGVGDKKSVDNLKSVMKKIGDNYGKGK